MSTPFRLLAPRGVVEAMIAQALAERPYECCGLLAGAPPAPEAGEESAVPVGRVVERYPLVNALRSPVEFESEPRGLFEAHRDMRRRGLEILAVYHSHPTSAAVPSRTDLARNYSPDVVNLIISLATDPPDVRGWRLTDDSFREADWSVDEEEGRPVHPERC